MQKEGKINLAALSQKFESMLSKLEEQELIKIQLEEKIKEREQKLAEEIHNHKADICEAYNEINRIQQVAEEQMQFIKDMTPVQTELIAKDQMLIQIDSQITSLLENIKQLDVQIKEQAYKNNEVKLETQKLKNDKEARFELFQQQLDQNAVLKAKLENNDQIINKNKQMIKELQEKFNKKCDIKQRKEEQISGQIKQFDSVNRQLSASKNQLKEFTLHFSQIQNKVKSQLDQIIKLRSKNQILEQSNEVLQDQALNLQNQIHILKDCIQEANNPNLEFLNLSRKITYSQQLIQDLEQLIDPIISRPSSTIYDMSKQQDIFSQFQDQECINSINIHTQSFNAQNND